MLSPEEIACREGDSGWFLVVEYLYYDNDRAVSGETCPEDSNNEFATGWPNGDWSYYRVTYVEESPERKVQKYPLSEASPNTIWQLSRQEDIAREDWKREPKARNVYQYVSKNIDGEEIEELAFVLDYYPFSIEKGCRDQDSIFQLHQPPVIIDYRFVYCGGCPPGYVGCQCEEKLCCYSCREVVRYVLGLGGMPEKYCLGEDPPPPAPPKIPSPPTAPPEVEKPTYLVAIAYNAENGIDRKTSLGTSGIARIAIGLSVENSLVVRNLEIYQLEDVHRLRVRITESRQINSKTFDCDGNDVTQPRIPSPDRTYDYTIRTNSYRRNALAILDNENDQVFRRTGQKVGNIVRFSLPGGISLFWASSVYLSGSIDNFESEVQGWVDSVQSERIIPYTGDGTIGIDSCSSASEALGYPNKTWSKTQLAGILDPSKASSEPRLPSGKPPEEGGAPQEPAPAEEPKFQPDKLECEDCTFDWCQVMWTMLGT